MHGHDYALLHCSIITGAVMSQDQLEAARAWISNCQWPDLEPDDIEMLTDAEVVRAIERHYAGGLAEFIYIFELTN